MTFLAILLSALAVDPGAAPLLAAWRFVAPPPGDPFEHPPSQAISLSSTKPEDIVEKVVYHGRPRYAEALLRQSRLDAGHCRGRRGRPRGS